MDEEITHEYQREKTLMIAFFIFLSNFMEFYVK